MTRGVISERTYIARSPLFWLEYTLPHLCDIGLQQHPDIACVREPFAFALAFTASSRDAGSRLGFDLKAHGLETG